MRFLFSREEAGLRNLRLGCIATGLAVFGGACSDNVSPPVPATLSLSPSSLHFDALGEVDTLTAEVIADDGSLMDGVVLQWNSSNESIATVTDGVVTATGNGTAMIEASAEGLVAATDVSVQQDPAVVDIRSDSIRFVSLQDSTQLSVVVEDAGGAEVMGTQLVWASSDSSVAAVSSGGTVTAAANGEAVITAVLDGARDSAVVVVAQEAASVAIEVDDDRSWLELGDLMTIRARAVDNNGYQMNGQVSFEVEHEGVGSVSADGVFTAEDRGWTFVYARANGAADSVEIAVDPWLAVQTFFDTYANGYSYQDILLMRPDGSEVRRLGEASGITISYDPHWSADGEFLYFWGEYPDDYQSRGIYELRVDGGDPRLLFPVYGSPVMGLSPDGSKLAFVENDWDGWTQIGVRRLRVMDLSTLETEVLLEDTSYSGSGMSGAVHWINDGNDLLFPWEVDDYYSFNSIPSAGGSVVELLGGQGNDRVMKTVLSPDSGQLALVNESRAAVYTIETAEMNQFYHMHGGDLPEWDMSSATIGYVNNGRYVVQDVSTGDTTTYRLIHGFGGHSPLPQARDATGHRVALALRHNRFLMIYPHRRENAVIDFSATEAEGWIFNLMWRP